MTGQSYELISADSHIVEPPDLFQTRVPQTLRDRAPKVVPVDGGEGWAVGDAASLAFDPQAATGSAYRRSQHDGGAVTFDDVMPALHDPAERVKAQLADSVDAEIIYPSATLWDLVKGLDDAELRTACVRAYNEWIAEFCSQAPERLFGIGKIPCGDTAAAVAELQRCADLGLRGVMLDAWPSGGSRAADPADEPFWEAAASVKLPVSVHWALGAQTSSAPSSGIEPGLTPPMADVVLPMIAGRVFDRHPDLRLVLAHGDAGWLLHWLEFRDINYVRHRHLGEFALEDPDALPSDYFRRHCWFTFSQDRVSVKNRHKIGAAHLMWASHFPMDVSEFPDDRQRAMRTTEEVPKSERTALLAGNAARLYRLPGHEHGFDDAEVSAFEVLVHY
jgi:predicted TIM-barrel fold metal-dependent hydrolase